MICYFTRYFLPNMVRIAQSVYYRTNTGKEVLQRISLLLQQHRSGLLEGGGDEGEAKAHPEGEEKELNDFAHTISPTAPSSITSPTAGAVSNFGQHQELLSPGLSTAFLSSLMSFLNIPVTSTPKPNSRSVSSANSALSVAHLNNFSNVLLAADSSGLYHCRYIFVL